MIISKKRLKQAAFQTIITLMVMLIILLAFVPVFLMLFLSLKLNYQIMLDFWALPIPPAWSNYQTAWSQLIRNMINSLITVSVGTLLTVALSSTSGYVFARLDFPMKNFLFMAMMALMMIPGVLTLTPAFKLMQRLRLTDTWFALWFPWASGGQIMGMYLCRTFISEQPAALFESARIDGATEFQAYYKIALPLSKPILATLAVMNLIGFYNDFIWPLLVISDNRRQVISVAIRVFQTTHQATNYGAMIAGFAIAIVPLLLMFMASSRLYIEGITSGAVKA
ncbi:MAG: carbohydrate ABC transporter permease [Christensenellales bacterium]|jgi:ABC-type glycerol-3-phosphate transport system permease component